MHRSILQRVSTARVSVAAAAACLLVLASFAVPRAVAMSIDDDEETVLGQHMDSINKAARALRVLVRKDDAPVTDMVDLVQEMQNHAVQAKGLVPKKASEFEGAARGGFLTDYRRQMIDFLESTFAMERALLDGDREKVQEIYKQFNAIKRESHERFKAKDD